MSLINNIQWLLWFHEINTIIDEIKEWNEVIAFVPWKWYLFLYTLALDEENIPNSYFLWTKFYKNENDAYWDFKYYDYKIKYTFKELQKYWKSLKFLQSLKVIELSKNK